MMEASNLQCMLKCKLLDFSIVEHVVGLVPVLDVGHVCGVDAAGSFHVLDDLFGGDLGVVAVLIDGEHKGQREHMVQVFYELLVCNAGHIVHLGDHEELIEGDEESFN